MEQLTEYELIPESWVETQFCRDICKICKNLDELLDMILLEAEMLNYMLIQTKEGQVLLLKPVWIKERFSNTLLVQQGVMLVIQLLWVIHLDVYVQWWMLVDMILKSYTTATP